MAGRRRLRVTRRGRRVALAVVALSVAALAWRVDRAPTEPAVAEEVATETIPTPAPSPTPAPVAWRPAEAAAVADLDAMVADGLVASAPIVVVADPTVRLDRDLGAWLAGRLQAPLVSPEDPLADTAELAIRVGPDRSAARATPSPPPPDVELRRVTRRGASAGAAPAAAVAGALDAARLTAVVARPEPPVAADLTDVVDLLDAARPAAASGTVLLARPDVVGTPTVATALALGHHVVVTTASSLWDDARVATALGGTNEVLGFLGPGWDTVDPGVLAWQAGVVRAGNELPGGGYRMFPDRRLVALYGHPDGGALGVLGEQPVGEAVVRAQEQAAVYAELVEQPVVPTFELIATVASAGAGERGDYSRRTGVATLRPWVDAARDAGMYVVLDLQSGRTDFLSQAKEYEELLREPHVGLALDPEWRLGPSQVHLRQIGSVSGHEVEEVATWLAELVRAHDLPQKLLIVHQFKLTMIRDRAAIDASRPELATLIQMDGQGSQGAKLGTYATIVRDAPPGVWWGWKNFHDEDVPTRSPADTVALDPSPVFISYQ